MAFTTFENAKALKKSANDNALCTAQPVETRYIYSLNEIEDQFDVFLFAAEGTLSKDNHVLPAGAIAVPRLRQSGKKVGVFSIDFGKKHEDLVKEINHLGLSFSYEDILLLEDLHKVEEKYTFFPPHRILMICSNLMTEVAIGKMQGFTTLLIEPEEIPETKSLGIWSHYTARSV